MQALDAQEYKPILSGLFDKYIEATMAHCRHAFKVVVALPAVSQAMTVCKILEGILPRVRCPAAAGSAHSSLPMPRYLATDTHPPC